MTLLQLAISHSCAVLKEGVADWGKLQAAMDCERTVLTLRLRSVGGIKGIRTRTLKNTGYLSMFERMFKNAVQAFIIMIRQYNTDWSNQTAVSLFYLYDIYPVHICLCGLFCANVPMSCVFFMFLKRSMFG